MDRIQAPDELDRRFLQSARWIDVRSPGEFREGHLPGSVNLPILNDEERKRVGTLYRKEGQERAISLGQELVSGEIREQRIRSWIQFLKSHPESLLYCARGGLRSEIAAAWIREAGGAVERVNGGYKTLRNHLLGKISERVRDLSFRIVGGKTGSGKTRFLEECGLPHIDLEALANHRGSSFGSLGEQPAQATFENALAVALLRIDAGGPPPLLEDESVMIGSISLPPELHRKMKSSPIWILDPPLPERVRNIANDYVAPRLRSATDSSESTRDFFLAGLQRIERKLGGLRKSQIESQIRAAFHACDPADLSPHFGWIESLLVHYYDPYYEQGLEKALPRIAGRGDKNALASQLRLS